MSAIKVELELVDGSFTTRMLHAGETIQQFNRNVARSSPELRRLADSGQSVIRTMERMEESSGSFLGTLRDVSIVVGAVSMGMNKVMNIQDSWIGKIVQTNAAFERLIFQMRSMSKSSDPIKEAASDVNSLIKEAGNAPFALDTLTKGFTKLKATGTDPLKGSLRALEDGVAAFGGTDEVFDRATLAITQMSGKGVIQMEELRQQLGEAMPNAVQLMAASMGVSMANLIQKISTGRLAAKPALDLFYAELDRSFGGTAQRMMQTFSGQLVKTRTEIQQFARDVGGIDEATGLAAKGGFMDTLAGQLRDLNDALASGTMKNFAQELGQGLSTAVTWLRDAAEAAWKFRAAIGNMVEIGVAIAGFRMLSGLVGMVRGAYTSLGQSLTILSAQFGRANAAAALHNSALTNTANSIATVDRAARLQAVVGLRSMLSVMTRVAPAAGLIGLAIYEVADAFDVFGNRGKEAIATLREFGRIAEDQMGKAEKNVSDRQADLTKEMQQIVYEANHSIRFGSQDSRKKAIQEEIAEKMKAADIDGRQKQLDEDRLLIQQNRTRLAKEEAEKIAERQLRGLDDLMQGEQLAYKSRQEQIQKEADDRIANAKTTGEKVNQIEKDRQEKLYASAKTLMENQQRGIQSELDKLYNSQKQGPLMEKDLLVANKLNEKLGEIRAKSDGLKPFGEMPDVGKADNSEKDQAKGEKLLTKTKDAVESLKEQLHYSNDELADFHAKFARGAYGDTSLKEVQDLGREIENLLIKKKALDDINEGSKDIQQDLEQARIKLIEKRMELNEKASGEELTAGEKIAMRIKEGYYKGFGPNSPAIQAIAGATQGLTLQGKTAQNVGEVMRTNAFGSQTLKNITTVTDRLKELLGVMNGIGNSAGAITFAGFGKMANTSAIGQGPLNGMSGFSGLPTSGANLMSKHMETFGDPRTPGWADNNITSIMASNGMTVQVHKAAAEAFKGFLDELIGQGYNVKSIGGYALRNNVNAPGKLSEHAFGNAIDINPGANPNGKTLVTDMPNNIRELALKYGLTWGGDFKNMKDAMHFEWKGGGNGPAQPVAPKQGPQLPDNSITNFDPSLSAEIKEFMESRNKLQEEYLGKAAEIAATEKDINQAEKAQFATDYKKKLKEDIDAAAESLDGYDKRYRATLKVIQSGKTGSKDVNTAENKELLELAKKLDATEKSMADRKEASNNLDSAQLKLKQAQVEAARKIAEFQAKAKNPNVKLDSSGLIELREQMDKVLEWTTTVYGKDSDEYKKALDQKNQMLRQFSQQEAWSETAASAKKTQDLRASLMTERQQREYAMQQELAEVDARVEYARKNNALDVEMVRQAEAEKAAIRQKYAAESPMTKQMKEWADMSGNLEKATTGWMDSMVDGLAGLITGTGDLRQTIQGIANDLIKIALKGMIGQMKSGSSGGAASAAKGIFSKGGKGGVAVGMRHRGGSAGVAQQMTVVNPNVFKNARKFHTGANEIGGRRLLPGEVPIIAKKDEGIFTPEQMKMIGAGQGGGNQAVTINAPVTVNANGGTPQQNADLAKQTAKEMEGTLRGLVADEMMKQMKPGNMMNSGRRN